MHNRINTVSISVAHWKQSNFTPGLTKNTFLNIENVNVLEERVKSSNLLQEYAPKPFFANDRPPLHAHSSYSDITTVTYVPQLFLIIN